MAIEEIYRYAKQKEKELGRLYNDILPICTFQIEVQKTAIVFYPSPPTCETSKINSPQAEK